MYLTELWLRAYNADMQWEVRYTDEFEGWFEDLDAQAREAVARKIALLEIGGPALGRPHVDSVYGSRHANMKELRAHSAGRPLRMFFAFDPTRAAIMLIGGDKTGDKRFYDRMIALADELFAAHLATL
jgi:hypothetical protein